MAAIHTALQSLSPTTFSTVPTSDADLASYLESTFADASLLVDSVPPPPDASPTTAASRPRAASAVSLSSSRSAPAAPARVALQAAWGRPLKLSAKDNPLDMHVYKLAGADGRGAWFARRSVHEGLGFAAWRDALRTEFPLGWSSSDGEGETEGGAKGSGIVRTMKGERLVEERWVKGVGKMEVVHLRAQFPGPAAPRDFVPLLLTRTSAARPGGPRSFVMVSKPCEHAACPSTGGVVRGQYESVEFIREVPRGKNRKAASAVSLPAMKTGTDGDAPPESVSASAGEDGEAAATRRKRGKSVSFAGPADDDDAADAGDAADAPAVEWIHVTRSDPGGSVPRFLVDRGTPGGICTDAVKFVDWAAQRGAPERDGPADFDDWVPPDEPAPYANGVDGARDAALLQPADAAADGRSSPASSTLLQAATATAASTLESYAPRALAQRLVAPSSDTLPASSASPASSSRSPLISSDGSFASAADFASSPAPSITSGTSGASPAKKAPTPEEAAIARLEKKRAELDAQLRKARERESRESEGNKEKEASRRARAEEKHRKDVARAEEAHAKAIKELRAKKEREEKRSAEKEEKAREKARRKEELAREKREREDVKLQLEIARKAAEVLRRENERLVAENERLERENEELKGAAAEGGAGTDGQEIPAKS